jgi:hypothetical protein
MFSIMGRFFVVVVLCCIGHSVVLGRKDDEPQGLRERFEVVQAELERTNLVLDQVFERVKTRVNDGFLSVGMGEDPNKKKKRRRL